MRKYVKRNATNKTIDNFIEKYNIPRAYLSINRKSVSKAILVGVFIAMIPMPFQMLAILLFIPFLRFNVPVALTLCWITNPFTMPFIYYLEYVTGTYLTFSEGISDIHISIAWFQKNLDDIFIPLYVGALFYSIVLSVTSYFLVNYLWMYSVCKENKIKGKMSLKERFSKKK